MAYQAVSYTHLDVYKRQGVALLKIPPLSVQPVLVGVRGIDDQLVDIHQIGLVHRVGPAEMLVVAMQHEWRPWKEAARDVPAFSAVEHRLIPRDRAGIRLMGIDQQPRGSIRGTRWRDGDGVRSDRQRFVCPQESVLATVENGGDGAAACRAGQLRQHVVQPIEERQLEDESGHHILAGEWKQAARYLARMERRVIVHAVGISLDVYKRQLVRRQAELKYLDETSRKELNCGVEDLGAGAETVPDIDAIAEAERLYEEVRTLSLIHI